MKIRQGFVSNSSSSSFVIFVEKKDYDKIVAELSVLEKDILSAVSPEKIKAFGKNLMKIGYMSGNYSTLEDYTYEGKLSDKEEDDLENEGADCILDKIVEKFKKTKNYLEHSENF